MNTQTSYYNTIILLYHDITINYVQAAQIIHTVVHKKKNNKN